MELACVPPTFVVRLAPLKAPFPVPLTTPITSGFATKKFAGIPAASALFLKVLLPMRPVAVLVDAKPNGFGFMAARNPRFVELVHCELEYFVESLDWAAGTRSKKAANPGSGDVPGTPVSASAAARPAAMF